jgi:putative transposase
MEREILVSGHLLRQGAAVRFAFIRDHRREFPIEALRDALGVSRSGFYARDRRPPSARDARRAELAAKVRQAHAASHGIYGSPRVHRTLLGDGVTCCANTVAGLMRAERLRSRAKRRYRPRTTDSRHDHPVAGNVLGRAFHPGRAFYPGRANRTRTADITYVETAEGWLHLAVVLDLFSRRVIGWAPADHLRAELACEALGRALGGRRPSGELLHHSDRGSRYAGSAFQAILARHGVEPSMSRAGDCHDNAVTGSFFSSPKGEWARHHAYATRERAATSLFEYIEVFYNRKRLHSTLNYRSPVAHEARFVSRSHARATTTRGEVHS